MHVRHPTRILVALALFLASAASNAQLFRAYVSITGNDANPCTLPSPCRLLPAALSAVAPGGEIWMLDSGNFNVSPVDVSKSVTILAVPGALGSVVASGGDAMVISADVDVTLRNLVFVPLPGNAQFGGLNVAGTGADVTVLSCHFSGFSDGLPAVRSSVNARLSIEDSVFVRNEIGIEKMRGSLRVSHSRFFSNGGFAVRLLGSVGNSTGAILSHVTIIGTLNSSGISANAPDGGPIQLTLANSTLGNLTRGVEVEAQGLLRASVGNTVIASASTPFYQAGTATLESFGDNIIRGGGADVGTITTVSRR